MKLNAKSIHRNIDHSLLHARKYNKNIGIKNDKKESHKLTSSKSRKQNGCLQFALEECSETKQQRKIGKVATDSSEHQRQNSDGIIPKKVQQDTSVNINLYVITNSIELLH